MYIINTIILFILALVCCYINPAYSMQYWQTYGPAKIVTSNLFYQDFNQHIPEKPQQLHHNIVVIIPSKNILHLDVAKTIFSNKRKFNQKNIRFVMLDNIPSKIAAQPLGVHAAMQGAKNRFAITKNKMLNNTDNSSIYYFNIEDFLTKPEVYSPRWHLLISILDDANNHLYHYVSDGIYIEPEIYDATLDKQGLSEDGTGANYTLGKLLADLYHVRPNNWQQFLTCSKMSFVDQALTAITTY